MQDGVTYNGDGTFNVLAESSSMASGSGLGNLNSFGDLVGQQVLGYRRQ